MRSTTLSALAGFAALAPFTAAQSTSSKRGLCHVPSQKYPGDDSIWISGGSDLTWYYNYQAEPSDAYKNKNIQFVPMLWGAKDSDTGTPFYDSVKSQIDGGANISYVLGFNEPDGTHTTGGSALPVDLAAARWIAEIEPLKKLGIKLGAPAVTGGASGWAWLQNWFTACNGSCTPDFIPVHWYGNFDGMASHIGNVMATYPNMTVWVTEYALPNQDLKTTQDFYNTSKNSMDSWGNITHYSYFGAFRSDVSNVGPNAAMLDQKGKLTDIGSWYMGGVATNNIPKGAGGRIQTIGLPVASVLALFWACML
ncbi:uncharacterized protein EKO05_0000627 [Ascochyta rabiei]|uniref:Asl1-like glycosyl hydrolase catalytic domain-containing protein n=1 Tax=Didymella rabiei TaxID=5454 RepID=A0A163HLJ4_DIDRA|nr:uncharacterized protein EKO05_0000627 [Ascochyta rabiei]KZM25351.1 hypothetical protein ST47_g3549 [Ascochyta rabiei]UPX09950.1 hypothetical protein EKO05_0000627 [Ascochyta rabiei]